MYENESKKKKKWKGRQTERREIGQPVRAVAIHGISYFTKKMIFTYNPGRGGIKKSQFSFFSNLSKLTFIRHRCILMFLLQTFNTFCNIS